MSEAVSQIRDVAGLEMLLATGTITFNELVQKRGVRAGYILDARGKLVHVIHRTRTGNGALNEVRAYRLHMFSPFTNEFPVTVQRSDGLVQERLGKCLLDRGKFAWRRFQSAQEFPARRVHRLPSLDQFLIDNAFARDQMEQTAVERWILAERDGKLDNVLVTCRHGLVRFANVDMEGAFLYEKDYNAYHLTVESLIGAAISQPTLDKVQLFKSRLAARDGQALLEELEMRDLRLGLNSRLDQIIADRHFPRA